MWLYFSIFCWCCCFRYFLHLNKFVIIGIAHISIFFVHFKTLPGPHTGKCIRRFGGIYAYCRYFIDQKW